MYQHQLPWSGDVCHQCAQDIQSIHGQTDTAINKLKTRSEVRLSSSTTFPSQGHPCERSVWSRRQGVAEVQTLAAPTVPCPRSGEGSVHLYEDDVCAYDLRVCRRCSAVLSKA